MIAAMVQGRGQDEMQAAPNNLLQRRGATRVLPDRSDPAAIAVALVDDAPLREPAELVYGLLGETAHRGWSVDTAGMWTRVTPPVTSHRLQGWKLHVSATVVSAPEVLRACAAILIEAQTPFKFAANAKSLMVLTDARCPRGHSGKFVTVYPASDQDCTELASALHDATAGLPGPAILSDAPYLHGSLVHCRYGVFEGLEVLGNDGTYRHCLVDPDGNPVEDSRPATFQPPTWATPPFPRSGADLAQDGAPSNDAALDGQRDRVILCDRYEIAVAIRHANKGGVYRAHDRAAGREVIIKEARPQVGADRHGRDAVDMLRHEARVLSYVGALGLAPRLIDEFSQEGHFFLVEELVEGESLRRRTEGPDGAGDEPNRREVLDLAVQLAGALGELHRRGVVLRDLSPNNIMRTPTGALRILDLEMAALHEDGGGWAVFGIGGGTPGISAPEQFMGASPDPAADLYSLGATILYLVTGASPEIPSDDPVGRRLEARISAMLSPPLCPLRISGPLRQIIVGLMRELPADRLPLREVLGLAARADDGGDGQRRSRVPPGRDPIGGLSRLSDDRWRSLVGGIARYLAAQQPRDPAARPWAETTFGEAAQPCTVQHGLAGGLAVLVRLSDTSLQQDTARLRQTVLERVAGHHELRRHRLPGLYFGFAGTAWALFDAGRELGRPELMSRAVALAQSLPTRWPNPDITHGLAGLGSCLLYLAGCTGRADLVEQAVACAEQIVEMADNRQGTIAWTVDRSFDSELAGYCSYGFAHGTAGIGAFLLATAHVARRPDLARTAERCGETLLACALHDGDAAFWPATPDSATPLAHWCNGSSGVGTFLARLYLHTGESHWRAAAVAAARAVMKTRARTGTAYCHGLAGNGDFLIDLANVTGDERFLAWAEELAAVLWARRVYRDGLAVLPDETGRAVTGGYGAGLAGHLSFLLRLRKGGPRLFHPDPSLQGARLSSI